MTDWAMTSLWGDIERSRLLRSHVSESLPTKTVFLIQRSYRSRKRCSEYRRTVCIGTDVHISPREDPGDWRHRMVVTNIDLFGRESDAVRFGSFSDYMRGIEKGSDYVTDVMRTLDARFHFCAYTGPDSVEPFARTTVMFRKAEDLDTFVGALACQA